MFRHRLFACLALAILVINNTPAGILSTLTQINLACFYSDLVPGMVNNPKSMSGMVKRRYAMATTVIRAINRLISICAGLQEIRRVCCLLKLGFKVDQLSSVSAFLNPGGMESAIRRVCNRRAVWFSVATLEVLVLAPA
jgi:hypothetical protein